MEKEVQKRKKKQKRKAENQNIKKKNETTNKSQKINPSKQKDPIKQETSIKRKNKEKNSIPKKRLKLKKNVILIIFFLTIFSISTFKLAHFYIDLGSNNQLNEELIKEVLNTEVSANEEDQKLKEILTVDFEKLFQINSDTKGWIRFNDNKVNNPLVQTDNNQYYLDHSFQKKKNSLGTLFIDHRNKTLEDQNVVIFGHNAVDDSMFGSLVNIFEKGFFDQEEHRKIEIIDPKEVSHVYEIVSYYVIEAEEYYITTSFSNQNEFQDFLNTIKKRSIKNFGINLTTSDKILTLSTCNGNGGTTKRTVIHAKKIS